MTDPAASIVNSAAVSTSAAESGWVHASIRDLMHNALEEVVGEVFDRLAQGRARFCHCAQCRDDVITHTLNQARPRYVSRSLIGSAITRVALSHEQVRAELAVLVLDAMRTVSARPRHPKAASTDARGPG